MRRQDYEISKDCSVDLGQEILAYF